MNFGLVLCQLLTQFIIRSICLDLIDFTLDFLFEGIYIDAMLLKFAANNFILSLLLLIEGLEELHNLHGVINL